VPYGRQGATARDRWHLGAQTAAIPPFITAFLAGIGAFSAAFVAPEAVGASYILCRCNGLFYVIFLFVKLSSQVSGYYSHLTSVSASYTSISKSLPKSGNTVRAWTMQLFSEQKRALIRLLESPHVVHFTFDLWSSPNHLAILGLVAHWINLEGRACHALLGLRKMCGAHTGENQSQVVLTLLQEYFLVEKVGYFTLDNASNNDTALACLSKKLQDMGIVFDARGSRLRCIGHVINLVVKAFLYGYEFVEDIQDQNSTTAGSSESWRKRVPYGKLQNIITYICWTL